jgi:hypothetical protein
MTVAEATGIKAFFTSESWLGSPATNQHSRHPAGSGLPGKLFQCIPRATKRFELQSDYFHPRVLMSELLFPSRHANILASRMFTMVEDQRSSLQFHVSSSKWSGTVVSLRFNQYPLLNCPVLYFVSKCYLCGTPCTSASI